MDVSKLMGDSSNIKAWLKFEKQKQSLALSKIVQSVAEQAKKHKETKKSKPVNDLVAFSSRDGTIRLSNAVSRLRGKMADIQNSDMDKEQKAYRVSEIQRKINSIEILISDIKRKEREAAQKEKKINKKFDAYKYVLVQRDDLRKGDESEGFSAEVGMAAGSGMGMDMGFAAANAASSQISGSGGSGSSGGSGGSGSSEGSVDVEL